MASRIVDEGSQPLAWKIDHPRFGIGCVLEIKKYGHSRAILFTRDFYTRINKKDIPNYLDMRVPNNQGCGLNRAQIQALINLVNPPVETEPIQQPRERREQKRLIPVKRPRRSDNNPRYQKNDSLLFKAPYFASVIVPKNSTTQPNITQQGVTLLNREPRRKQANVVFGDRRGVIRDIGYFDENKNGGFSVTDSGSALRVYKIKFDIDDAREKKRGFLPVIPIEDIDDDQYVIDPRQEQGQ